MSYKPNLNKGIAGQGNIIGIQSWRKTNSWSHGNPI